MTGTMTYVGFDVHARSTHAAAIDVMTGELTRMRFGAGVDAPVEWLRTLSGPVRACYEAGPTGYGLYRAAVAAGVGIEVIAPGLTPRGKSDRIKTDRKDAELLARCLIAGSLHAGRGARRRAVEAARELTRAHDACRRDLMNARHRVSKMLLRHGRVYPEPIDLDAEAPSLARRPAVPRADVGAHVGGPDRVRGRADRPQEDARRADRRARDRPGMVADRRAVARVPRRGHAHRARDPSRARRRLARGSRRPTRVGSWLGLTPSRQQSGEHDWHGSITKTGSSSPAACWSSPPGNTPANPGSVRRSRNRQDGQPDHILQICNRAQQRLHHLYTSCGHAASPTTSRSSRSRASCRASSGPPPPHPNQQLHQTDSSTPAQEAGTPGRHSGRHARSRYGQHLPGCHARS